MEEHTPQPPDRGAISKLSNAQLLEIVLVGLSQSPPSDPVEITRTAKAIAFGRRQVMKAQQ
jgi:hypothetical protein